MKILRFLLASAGVFFTSNAFAQNSGTVAANGLMFGKGPGVVGYGSFVPATAGDIPYWNGSSYSFFAGNTSGTRCFSENASGVPSWVTCGGALTGPVTITSNSANALAVGPNGATNPAFNIDASTASSATGLQVKSAAAGGAVALATISSGTNESLSINAKGSGIVGIGSISTGGVQIAAGGGGAQVTGALTSGNHTITSTSSNALAVGPNGTTNPTLQVDGSVSSEVTGVKISGFAVGIGAGISAISSGTNEPLSLNSKGSSPVIIANSSTGGAQVTGALTSGSHAVTSSSSNSLTAGANGTTNPAFNVDASTASSVTGVQVKSAASGGSVAVVATSSASNEGMSINAKGSGIIGIGGISTGGVHLGDAGGPIVIGGTDQVAAWTSYTPTVTAGSGTCTSCPASGRWHQFGKTVWMQTTVTITTVGTAANAMFVSLPTNSAAFNYVGICREDVTTGNTGSSAITGGSNATRFATAQYAGATWFVAGYQVDCSIMYEIP